MIILLNNLQFSANLSCEKCTVESRDFIDFHVILYKYLIDKTLKIKKLKIYDKIPIHYKKISRYFCLLITNFLHISHKENLR